MNIFLNFLNPLSFIELFELHKKCHIFKNFSLINTSVGLFSLDILKNYLYYKLYYNRPFIYSEVPQRSTQELRVKNNL